MPSKSKAQQRLFQMALAVRKGELSKSEVGDSVLSIVDGDMTNKQIEDFCVLEFASYIIPYETFDAYYNDNLNYVEKYQKEIMFLQNEIRKAKDKDKIAEMKERIAQLRKMIKRYLKRASEENYR